MTWALFDELYASFARPTAVYACGVAVAVACLIPASAPIAIPTAGAVILGYSYFRSQDKQNAASNQPRGAAP